MSPITHPTLQARSHALARFLLLLRTLISNQTGSSALEHAMVLALILLGTTSVVGSAASFFAMAAQHVVSTLGSLLPA